MEKITFYYHYTSNSNMAFAFLPGVLKEISGDHKIFLKSNRLSDEWIPGDADVFMENLKLDLSYENEFLNDWNSAFRYKFKIEDNGKTISYIEFYEVFGLLRLNIVYDKNFNYEEWENKFSYRFALEKVSDDEVEEAHYSLSGINRKIVAINRKLDGMIKYRKNVRKVFVSMRFDEHSKSLAYDLNKFFSLVNLEVITGMGVEPRSVSEKVEERMSGDIDLFIVLLTKSGISDWLNQEIGFAKARKIRALVLRETGTDTINPGMLSDDEYIKFDKISETYIGILEAIKYLENTRASGARLNDFFYV